MTCKTIMVRCLNNGIKKSFERGTTLLEIFNDLQPQLDYTPLACLVNNQPKDLAYRVYKPKVIEFFDFSKNVGHRTYVRSLAFLLSAAVYKLYPEATLRIEHPVSNGYYCTLQGLPSTLTPSIIDTIRAKMHEIVQQNSKFKRREVETSDAIDLYEQYGHTDKIQLMRTIGKLHTHFYTLNKFPNYFYGNMVPSSGYLKVFGIEPYFDGILLQAPSRQHPDRLEPIVKTPKLMDVFTAFNSWNKVMNVVNIGDLNESSGQGKASELIMIAEAFQEKQVSKIAEEISTKKTKPKVILASGPSSSGKTTFSKRLMLQLKVEGLTPVALSMDNYFVDREQTPLDEKGEFDFESLYALDLPQFNSDLEKLTSGEEIDIPTFSFTDGKRVYNGEKLKLEATDILIIEGIHALNPELLPNIKNEFKFKIYVSALTTISIDNHNWIPTSDNRLIRRIVRDYRYRGYSASDTISRWPSVRKGENKWIYPYQENADAMFNSALLFELPVLKNYAEPILRAVKQDKKEYAEARRLLAFLDYFEPIHDNEIPPTSLLREFLGGSSFRY